MEQKKLKTLRETRTIRMVSDGNNKEEKKCDILWNRFSIWKICLFPKRLKKILEDGLGA